MSEISKENAAITAGSPRTLSVDARSIAAPTFEALWNTIPSPAIAVDGAGRVVQANPAAELFFAMSAATLSRRALEDVVGAASPLVDLAAQARRGGLSVSAFGVSLTLAELDARAAVEGGGRVISANPLAPQDARIVDIQAAPLFDAADTLLIMIQPRSVATEMDRAINGRGASRSLSGMAATLAHEIKNPLAGISGAVQLLETQLDDGDRDLARLIHEDIDRIGALLDQVDVFGELGLGERTPVNVHDVLDQARRSAAAGYGRDVRFVERYDPSLPPVPGDRGQLLQAVSNLVKNAVEACPRPGGEVVLATAYRAGVKIAGVGGAQARLPLEITVSDNGDGVPEELRPHIFEPFVTSKARGTGLGLALVAKIVGDHGGVVDCARRGRRTVFRILLPVWTGPASVRLARPSEGAEAMANRAYQRLAAARRRSDAVDQEEQ